MSAARSLPWSRFLIGAVFATATIGADATAQLEAGFHPPQIGLAMRPDYTRRDIHAFVEELRLDEDQRVVFESLFADYESAFQSAAEVVRDDLSTIRPRRPADADESRERQREIVEELRRVREEAGGEMNPTEMRELMRQRAEELREEFGGATGLQMDAAELGRMTQEMNVKLSRWSARKAELRGQFESDVKDIILTEEQRELWPALQRRLRREKTLSQGKLSGESVNLLQLVRDFDLTPADREAAMSRLGEYEIALDEALERRNAYLDSSEADLARSAQIPDLKLVSSVHERRAALHRAVRDVNDSHAESISGALTEESRGGLYNLYLHQGYPRVFRRTAADRVFNAARALDGIEPTTLARIDELKAAYLAELESFNERLVQIVRQHEPRRFQDQAVRREARLRGAENQLAEPDDPIRTAMQQRSALGEQYLRRLEALLTPDQLERLPDYGQNFAAKATSHPLPKSESPMERFDRDGNGRLDPDEIKAMRHDLSGADIEDDGGE